MTTEERIARIEVELAALKASLNPTPFEVASRIRDNLYSAIVWVAEARRANDTVEEARRIEQLGRIAFDAWGDIDALPMLVAKDPDA